MTFDVFAMIANQVSFHGRIRRNSGFPFAKAVSLSAMLLMVGALSGCGGGGGQGSPIDTVQASSPTPTKSSFIPNYVSNLATVRHWNKAIVTVGVSSPPTRDMTSLVQQAVDLWASKVSQDVTFRIVPLSANAPADVTIRWVDPATLPADAIGRTDVVYQNSDQALTSARVQVSQTLPDNFQVQVITHELGHALGVQGHSADNADLMYTNSHLPTAITSSDQNTILWGYSTTRAASASAPAPGLSTAHSICGSGE